MPTQPLGGFMGGYLQARAYQDQHEYDQLQADQLMQQIAEKQHDIRAENDVEAAVKSANIGVLAETDPMAAIQKLAGIMAPINPEKAANMLNTSMKAQASMSIARKKTLETNIQQLNAGASIMEGVKDMETLQSAAMQAKLYGIDDQGVYDTLVQVASQHGYAAVEPVLTAIKHQVVAAKDKAQIELEGVKIDTERARQRYINTRTNVLIPAQAEAARALAAKRAKTGDQGTKLTQSDRQLAQNLIQSEFDMIDSSDESYVASVKVLNRAADILQASGGTKTHEQAIREAYKAVKAEGAFYGKEKKDPTEGSLSSPMTIPGLTMDEATKSASGKIDPSKLEKNKVYAGIGKYWGQAVEWDGKQFKPVIPQEASSDADISSDEEDDADLRSLDEEQD